MVLSAVGMNRCMIWFEERSFNVQSGMHQMVFRRSNDDPRSHPHPRPEASVNLAYFANEFSGLSVRNLFIPAKQFSTLPNAMKNDGQFAREGHSRFS